MKSLKNNSGITLIEIIIVMVILSIIAVFVLGSLSTYKQTRELKTEAEVVVAYLEDAKSKTLASLDLSQYGVHFETDSVTLFKGSSYSSSDPDNLVHELSSSVEASSISLAGSAVDVVFTRLTGDVTSYGTITISLISNSSKQKIITVTSLGNIGAN